jgi:hypothetical protein
MAIQGDPPVSTGQLALPYTLGNRAFIQPICVAAGDRLMNVGTQPTTGGVDGGDVVPDGTAGMGAGYSPHWAYRPAWKRTEDLADPPLGGVLFDGLNGNAAVGPTIRVDLQHLYCPWAGVVTVEGGATPAGQPAPTILLISYAWDQQGRQRQRWEDTVVRLATMVRQFFSPFGIFKGEPLKFPRLPFDMRFPADVNSHTLTFFNALDSNGNPLPVQRPALATTVWTPDPQVLVLDNGPGTTPSIVRVNGQSNRTELGQYTRVRITGSITSPIIFGINL